MRRPRASQLCAALVVAHLCLTVPLAWQLSIYIDEAYTLHTTGSGVSQAVRQALRFEMQPPAYYALLGLWRKVDSGLFFARLFSVLCVAASILVAAMASRSFWPHLHPAWIAGVVAFTPKAVWAALEARPYAMSFLLATTLLWIFKVGFLSDDMRGRWRLVYAVLACAALLTQYYLGFLLAANGVALLVLGRWRALRAYVLWMLPVALAFAPLVLLVPGQTAAQTVTALPVSLSAALKSQLIQLEDALLSMAQVPGGNLARWLCRGILVMLALWAARDVVARRRRASPELIALCTIVLLVIISCVAVHAAFGGMVVHSRHTLFMMPAALLLLYGLLGAGDSLVPVVVATMLLFSASGWRLYLEYKPLAKYGDHARVAEYLQQAASPGQPVLVYPGEQALALGYHYTGRNEIVPLPGPAPLDHYDPRDLVWTSQDQIITRFRESTSRSQECWLITYGANEVMGYPAQTDLMEATVAARFRVEQRHTSWDGTQVRLLRRQTAAPAR